MFVNAPPKRMATPPFVPMREMFAVLPAAEPPTSTLPGAPLTKPTASKATASGSAMAVLPYSASEAAFGPILWIFTAS